MNITEITNAPPTMNKICLLYIAILFFCCDSKTKQKEARSSANKVESTSMEKLNKNLNILNDEADDVSDEFFEGFLMEHDINDSLNVLLDGNKDTTKLYGRNYKGKFLFEGDILINYPDTNGMGLAVGITNMSRKWPKKNGILTIPFHISKTFPNPERIQKAIDMWSKGTGVVFRQKKAEDAQSLFFVETSEGCFVTQVGRAGGEQSISLSKECRFGNVAHEIGHALGLYHEQSRSDRDKYVSIDLNQAGGKASQYIFAKYNDYNGRPTDIGEYDYNSIMHYPEKSYFRVREKYRGKLSPGIPGQRDSLSKGDIEAIKLMYSLR